jgi:hypothetical protein
VLKPFIRELPAPRSANSLRGKVHSVIKAASELQDSEGNPLMLSLIGTPSQTADRVTKAMQAILPPEDTPDVAQGTFISSHSWRKTGASALASFCSLFQVKRWGMWKTTSSCERYIDDTFQCTGTFMRELFDWMTTSRTAGTSEDWNGWTGYDGTQDEADDGITDDSE